jgi:pimeloyl-ACP methyl ester carboxylesterase
MAEDIRGFIEDKQLSNNSVLGHSMGGRAVMYLALKYPHLVDKLIVVDISPVGRIGMYQNIFFWHTKLTRILL